MVLTLNLLLHSFPHYEHMSDNEFDHSLILCFNEVSPDRNTDTGQHSVWMMGKPALGEVDKVWTQTKHQVFSTLKKLSVEIISVV